MRGRLRGTQPQKLPTRPAQARDMVQMSAISSYINANQNVIQQKPATTAYQVGPGAGHGVDVGGVGILDHGGDQAAVGHGHLLGGEGRARQGQAGLGAGRLAIAAL